MNKLFTKIAAFSVGLAMAIGVGVAVGSKAEAPKAAEALAPTYSFTSKAWADSTSSWTSDKDGYGTDARGVSVQQGQSGAGATTKSTYSGITKIGINCSKSNKGKGSISVKVGNSEVLSVSSFNTTATDYESSALSNLSGKVSFVVTCGTSTLYVQSITITYTPSTPSAEMGYKRANVELESSKTLGAVTCSNFTTGSSIWASSNTSVVTVSAVDSLTLSSGKYAGTSTPTITAAENASIGDTATVSIYDGGDTSKTTALASFTVTIGKVYYYEFTSKVYSDNGSQVLAADGYSPSWTLAGGKFFDYTDHGQQMGSNNNPANGATLTTSSFSDYIKCVKVNTSGGASVVGTVSVSINDSPVGSAQSFSSTPTVYTFTAATAVSGQIQISWSMTTAKGTFIKSIELIMDNAPVVEVESLSLGDDVGALSMGLTHQISPVFNGGESIPTDQEVTYVSSNPGVATVDETGLVTPVSLGTVTITGTAHDTSHDAADQITVRVTGKAPTKVNRTKLLPTLVGDTFNNLAGVSGSHLVITYTDNSQETITSYDSVKVLLDGNEISKDYAFQTSDTGKSYVLRYSETVADDKTYNVDTNAQVLSIVDKFAFADFEKSFTSGRQYLLKTDSAANSTLSVGYTNNEGSAYTVSATSSNTNVITVSSPSDDTTNHIFSVQLTPVEVGNASISITVTMAGQTYTTTSSPISVRSSDPVSGSHYEKVTDTSDIVDGQYLFVFEENGVAFDGSLAAGDLDAANNTIEVTPVDGEIAYSEETAAAEFTVDVTAGTVMSTTNEYYIYAGSYNNALKTTTSVETAGTIDMAIDEGDVLFTQTYDAGTSTLGFNNASNGQRFRFCKTPSDTGSSYRYIQLYILVEGEPGPEDLAFTYANIYLKFDSVLPSDQGTGLCISAGWFTSAKTAFLDATTPGDENFHLTKEARALICSNSFADAYARLCAWASANGQEVVYVQADDDYTIRAKQGSGLVISILGSNETTAATTTAIVVVSIVSAAAVGGYFFIRRRKVQ